MTRERPPGTPGYFGRRGTPFNSSYVTSPPINQTHWRVAGRDDEWFYLTQTRFPFIIFCPQTIRFLIIYWATLLSLYHRVFRAKVFVIYLTIARNLVSTCAPPARPVPTTIQTPGSSHHRPIANSRSVRNNTYNHNSNPLPSSTPFLFRLHGLTLRGLCDGSQGGHIDGL